MAWITLEEAVAKHNKFHFDKRSMWRMCHTRKVRKIRDPRKLSRNLYDSEDIDHILELPMCIHIHYGKWVNEDRPSTFDVNDRTAEDTSVLDVK